MWSYQLIELDRQKQDYWLQSHGKYDEAIGGLDFSLGRRRRSGPMSF
jgi:hypothetical protein